MADPSSAPVPEEADVVVVGAGLAGLACARVVASHGRRTVVLEASDGVGGRVRTDAVDGFLLDRGFQVLLTAYPEAQRQLDLGALDLQAFEPGARVRVAGRFHTVADPLRRPTRVLDTALAPVGSPGDKLRLARLVARVRATRSSSLLRRPDRTTADALAAEGIGERAVEALLRPLLGGIQLDLELGTSSRMLDVVLRSLAEGATAVPAAGMGAIPRQLHASLGASASVHLDAAVATVARAPRGHEVRLEGGGTVSAPVVVVATSGPAAARLLGVRDPGSKPVSCCWFAADAAPVRGRSLLLDGDRSGPAANVAVMSEVAPTYAPPGRALVAAACPGTSAPGVERDVRAQLRGWFGSAVEAWELLRVDRIEHGQPRADPPFSPKRSVDLGGGRFVTGDHRDTPSIQGALFSGRRCGEAVVAHLR